MIGALGEGFFQDAFLAGALNKVSDFEIVFEFEIFFGHKILRFMFCHRQMVLILQLCFAINNKKNQV
jgi:hypothetical protein